MVIGYAEETNNCVVFRKYSILELCVAVEEGQEQLLGESFIIKAFCEPEQAIWKGWEKSYVLREMPKNFIWPSNELH